jgi:hypothetical protein
VTWFMWNLTSFCLGTVVVSVQIGAQFAPNVPSAQKSFWTHPMVLRGDKAQVKARSIWSSANLDERLVHELRRTYLRIKNYFGRTRWNSYVTWVVWNITSFCFEIVLVSVQGSAQFAPNVPLAQNSFWTHPMVLRGDEAQVKARSVWR